MGGAGWQFFGATRRGWKLKKLMELSPAERNRHVYIVGKTASGKSTLMKTMAIDDMRNGKCVVFVDPHGPDVLDLLDHVPRRRTGDVCYIDLSETTHSVGFRITSRPQHLLSALHAIWSDSWGPRLAWFLINGLYALYYNPGTTLADLPPLYYDKKHREQLTRDLPNPETHRFWHKEFPSYPEKYREEAKGAIVNKIGQFLAVPEIHASITQRHPKLDLDVALSKQQIVFLNLSKGTVGDDAVSLYGALFLSALKDAVMSGCRRECNLFVDEFQSFGSTVFAPMLSETRKFGMNITLAHQFLHQLDELVRSAVLGNVGTIAAFTVGPEDAGILARHFDRDTAAFNPAALMTQPPFQAYVRRPDTETLVISVQPIGCEAPDRRTAVSEESRMRFARSRR